MNRSIKKSLISILMTIVLLFTVAFVDVKAAENTMIIKIDLSKQNVTFSSSCTAWVTGVEGEIDSSFPSSLNQSVSWTHKSNYTYYIYQSTNGLENYNIFDETFAEQTKLDILGYTDVESFGKKWDEIAKTKVVSVVNGTENKFSSTANKVTFNGNNLTFNVILHNLWSSYSHASGSDGAISFDAYDNSNTHITLNLRGDNRFHRIHYASSVTTNSMTIKDDESYEGVGTLTVVGNQSDVESVSLNGITRKYPSNHWDAAIGGNDNQQNTLNLNIQSGVIYAGTTPDENCTAIGAGGNGNGGVNISGGTVYAITSSTGTAIGGGIGHRSYGGNSDVVISDSPDDDIETNVYAYNFGQPFLTTLTQKTIDQFNPVPSIVPNTTAPGIPSFVPGTAIGGGSSIDVQGNQGDAKVTITGGNVYAYSVAGCAIGGGNSINNYAGRGVVNISGGNIEATSVESIDYSLPQGTGIGGGSSSSTSPDANKRNGGQATVTISGGNLQVTGIGGGTSVNGNGGTSTVTISGGYMEVTGIGGGTSVNGNGGEANVTVTGGTIDADSIGGGFSEANGYAYGNVEMVGGSMNSEVSTVVKGVDGEDVFLTRVRLYKDDDIQKLVLIDKIEFEGFSSQYNNKDIVTDEEGYVYLWIPKSSAVLSATIDSNLYEPVEEVDGKINVTDLGILKYESPKEHCYINIINSTYYTPSLSADIKDMINGFIIIDKNILFKYYLIADSDSYIITPYHAVTTSNGKVYQMANQLTKVDGFENIYQSSEMTIANNTQIIFNIRDNNGNSFYTLDLSNGNINVSEGSNNTIVVEQDGYVLNISKDDKLYVTSAGYPTDNHLTFNLDKDTEVDVFMDKVNAASDDSIIIVEKGIVNLEFSSSDNMIVSSNSSPIVIEEEGRLNISSSSAESNSIKLEASEGNAAISGQGTLSIEDNGGYLKFNNLSSNSNVPQISVGTYIYKGTKVPSYTANIYGGDFTFDVIGYLDKDGNLKSKDELGNDNLEDFTARGIFRVLTEVDSISEKIVDGSFVMVLQTTSGSKVGPITIKQGDIILVEGIDFEVSEASNKKTITIKGSAFRDGSLTIMAARVGLIPYVSGDFDDYYDGNPHNITLIYNEAEYIAYYSYSELNSSNYTTGNTDKSIFNETNVVNKTVYWYIVPIVIDPEYTIEPASGYNVINIKQAVNKWTKELTCPDVALNYAITPEAVSKFGTHYYKFYKVVDGHYVEAIENIDYKIEDGKYIFIIEGTYYIKAIVDEPQTLNFTGLDSGYIRFKVVEIAVFTDVVRNLQAVNGSSSVIGITANGEFTVRYEFLSASNMEFSFSTTTGISIPKGTKFTLIVFEESTTKYYYYNYEPSTDLEGSLQIKLIEFQLMGTKDNTSMFVEPNAGFSSNYQITVDLPDSSNSFEELEVRFSAVDSSVVRVQRNSNTNASFSDEVEIVANEDEITVDVTVTSNPGSGSTILAFTIEKDSILYDLNYVNITLNSGINYYEPIVYGNVILFNLGKSALQNVSFTLKLDNLEIGNYNIISDVRTINDSENNYLLGGINSSNHNISDDVAVQGDIYTAVFVKKQGDGLLIVDTQGQEISLQISISDSEFNKVDEYSGIEVVVEIYEQINNEYVIVPIPMELKLTLTDNVVSVRYPLSIPSGDEIYRLVFKVDNEICYYNFVVSGK